MPLPIAGTVDVREVRASLIRAGISLKVIERMWLKEHGIRVVNWNILKNDSN